jgi:hypothetical protein
VAGGDAYFTVKTPLGVNIRTTKAYWKQIVEVKHPSIASHEGNAKKTLKDPDEIRKSQKDPRVHLYYLNIGKLNVCVVADHETKTAGYIITAYLTDRIKEGEQIYVKS